MGHSGAKDNKLLGAWGMGCRERRAWEARSTVLGMNRARSLGYKNTRHRKLAMEQKIRRGGGLGDAS